MEEFKLNRKPKIESGFKIPELYFENFSEKNIQNLKTSEPKVISIYKGRKIWIYAAAAILVVSLSVPIFNSYNSSSTLIDKTTLESYLNSNRISNDDLVDLLDEHDIQNIKINSTIEDREIEEMLSTNSNLEDYIIN